MLIDQIPNPQPIRQRKQDGHTPMAVGLEAIVGLLDPLPTSQYVVRPPQIGQRVRFDLPVDTAGLDDVPIGMTMDLLGFQMCHLGPTIHNILGLSSEITAKYANI